MLDALEGNLRRAAIVYRYIAEKFLFLVNLKVTELEFARGIKLLMKVYLCPESFHIFSCTRGKAKSL